MINGVKGSAQIHFVCSRRLHVMMHLREHKKSQTNTTKTRGRRLEDLKHKKTGRHRASTTKRCSWSINTRSSHSQPPWSDSLRNEDFSRLETAWKHTEVTRALCSWVRMPPPELCCTLTVVFDWRNGWSNLTTIGRGWGSVSDGLGLQLVLWLLQPRCERKAPRSEGGVSILMNCCYCLLLVISIVYNTIQLYCLYVETFAFWLVIYIKTFNTVNNKTSTTQ